MARGFARLHRAGDLDRTGEQQQLLGQRGLAGIAFQELIELGFIRVSKPSGFSVKHRAATEYRLTEFTCDVTGELATKEFAKWKPEIQNTVQHMGHTVQHVGQPAPGKRAKAA